MCVPSTAIENTLRCYTNDVNGLLKVSILSALDLNLFNFIRAISLANADG